MAVSGRGALCTTRLPGRSSAAAHAPPSATSSTADAAAAASTEGHRIPPIIAAGPSSPVRRLNEYLSDFRSNRPINRRRLAILRDGIDHEGLRLLAVHSRRTRRHAGQCDSCDWRPLLQQLSHHLDRHVAIDDIAANEHRMAALIFFRDACVFADLVKIIGRLHLDVEAGVAQICRVALTTRALRVLVKRRVDRLGCDRWESGSNRCEQATNAEGSSSHANSPFNGQAIRRMAIIPDTW